MAGETELKAQMREQVSKAAYEAKGAENGSRKSTLLHAILVLRHNGSSKAENACDSLLSLQEEIQNSY